MDIPDCTTNVHKFDGVKAVFWATYAPQDSSLKDENHSPADVGDRVVHLQKATDRLRSLGHYAFYDPGQMTMWVFGLSRDGEASGESARSQESIWQVTKPLELANTAEGVLESSSITNSHGNLSAIAHNASISHGVELDVQKRHGDMSSLVSEKFEPTAHEIYPRLVEALSMSVVRLLSKEYHWLPIGRYCCIGVLASNLSNRDEKVFNLDDQEELEQHSSETDLLSLRVCWLSSGTITIWTSSSPVPGYQLLSDLGIDRSLDSLPVGDQVVMAPSGSKAVVLGYASSIHDSIKLTVADRLAQQGLVTWKTEPWLRLRLLQNGDHDSIVWPASLCLWRIRGRGVVESAHTIADIVSENASADPLVRAEDWYASRMDRASILATMRKNEELASSLQRQDSESEDDAIPLDDIGLNDNRAITQDMTGVYPTPPDGPPFNAYISSAMPQQGTQASAENTSILSANLVSTSSLAPSPILEHESAHREEDREESLFGDMDTDLFASNGLTEADFNFFDEPGVYGDIEPEATHSPTSPVPVEPSIASENVVLDDQPQEQPGTMVEEEDVPQPVEVETSAGQESSASDTQPLATAEDSCLVDSPLGPITLDAGLHDNINTADEGLRRDSFSRVRFRASLDKFDAKYAKQGRFRSEQTEKPEGEKPTIGLKQYRFPIPRIGSLQETETGSPDSPEDSEGNAEDHEEESSKTHSTPENDPTHTLQNYDGPTLPAQRKRKLEQTEVPENPATPAYSSSDASLCHDELADTMLTHNTDLFVQRPEDRGTDPLPHIVEESLSFFKPFSLDGKAFLRLAQVLADQVIMQSYPIALTSETNVTGLQCKWAETASLIDDLISPILSRILPGVTKCSLKQFSAINQTSNAQQVDVKDTAVLQGAAQRSLSRQLKGVIDEPHGIFHVQPPLVCVRRGNAPIDLAISALRFWEGLSLAPVSGTKDVAAVCVLPASLFVQERASSFLSAIGGAYRSLKLGTHHPCLDVGETRNGLVPVPMDSSDSVKESYAIGEACERVGRELCQSTASCGAFVIYMVNAFNEPTAMARLCEAFLKLLDAYVGSLGEDNNRDTIDMVLQIIPLSMIASTGTLTIPSPTVYKKIALEVYDRCAPNPKLDRPALTPFSGASAVQLAKVIPRSINLKLTCRAIDGSLVSDRCIHVSYCFSTSSQWLTASWTDSLGCLQWNASYYLAIDAEEVWPQFSEAAQDMWQTTLDIARALSAPYRIFIARVGPMPREEYDVWVSLWNQYQSRVLLTLLTIEKDPLLRCPKRDSALVPAMTPLATPTVTTFSPTPSGHGSTPSATATAAYPSTPASASFENDADARLVDVTEGTWGLCTGNTAIPDLESETSSPLFSGYLFKRMGARDEDGLLTCGVNLLCAQRPCEDLLKEVLIMYGHLATLARIRGIVDPVKSILPWHVAAAVKAHVALGATMRWTED